MTLLTICNAIADYTSGPRPASIAGNTNPEAQTILRIVNKVSKQLMKVYPWNILRKEHTFTAGGTETLVAAASMPSDFDRFVPETFWDRGANKLLSGPISAAEWAGRKAQSYGGDETKFIYRGGDILAQPTVASGQSMAFEYISNQYAESSGGTGQASFQADADVGVLDEELIALAATFDWLASEGLDSGKAFSDFKTYFDTLQENENATANIAVTADIFARDSRHFTGIPAASRTTVTTA
jgi:hypothetical protein